MGKLLRSTPLQLLICIVFAAFTGKTLPITWVSHAYSLSLFFIDSVLFLLPLIIFSYLFNALVAMDEKAPTLAFSLIIIICLSNALALCVAYFVGSMVIPHLAVDVILPETLQTITPLFRFPIQHGLRADYVALAAFVCAYLCIKTKHKSNAAKSLVSMARHLQQLVNTFLKRAFLPLLPLYVLGFMLKMSHEGTLDFLYTRYLPVFALNIGVSFIYVMALYKVVSLGYRPIGNLINNMLPAGIVGFSTMSGAVTIPVTIDCTEKNIQHPALAHMVIPTTSNMHMLGDDITVTLTAFTILIVHGMGLPSFSDFLPYILWFCVAKLACVGIAGASLLVILPVIKEHLGFSSEMVSLITTLYVLHDPFGTFHNVMGNGAFAIGVERIFGKLGLLKRASS